MGHSSMELWLLSKILPAASLYLGRGRKLNIRHRYKYLYGEGALTAEALWSQRLFFHFSYLTSTAETGLNSKGLVFYFLSGRKAYYRKKCL